MPQPVPDSLLSPARPIAGGRVSKLEDSSEVALGKFTFEIWAQRDSSGQAHNGWVEIYESPDAPPIKIPELEFGAIENRLRNHFDEPDTQEEIGIGIRDGEVALALQQRLDAGLLAGFLLTVTVVAVALTATIRSRRRASLFETIARHEMASREEERTRVAREIHDGPLQDIAALARTADLSAPSLRAVAAELRAVAAGLRPPALEDFGLPAALEDLAGRHAEASPPLAVRIESGVSFSTRFSADTELAIYRIVQEALTNAVSRGGARTAWVFLDLQGDRLRIVIRDDGRGLPDGVAADHASVRKLASAGHFGLAGMSERARALGGTMVIASGPGGIGTEVKLDAPAAEVRVPENAPPT